MATLDQCGGNKKEAARLLQLNRTTLLEKLKRKRETRATLGLADPSERLGPLPMTPLAPPDAGTFAELHNDAMVGGQALRA